MSAERYSQEQILCGLRIFWREQLRREPLADADTRLNDEFKDYGFWDKIGVDGLAVGIVEELQVFFGFSCPLEEWNQFFGWSVQDPDEWEIDVSPRFTIRGLADFIRERLKRIPLEPIAMLGKPCLTAGIFRGLEQLVRQIIPKTTRFGPSTPIRRHLRGEWLHLFWRRLRWIIGDRIPAPRRIELGCNGFFIKLGIGSAIALWRRDLGGLGLSFLVSVYLFWMTASFVESLNSLLNPLPKEINTFGDLARYLAVVTENQQSECASCSRA